MLLLRQQEARHLQEYDRVVLKVFWGEFSGSTDSVLEVSESAPELRVRQWIPGHYDVSARGRKGKFLVLERSNN